ncbi:MAG: trigger factor family protein [Bacteroidota bacterium]|nr:trigger factor family protein [Bacteroidota bacterium]
MEVNVLETGDMVRVLEIKATASDLETDVRLALRKLQSATTLRGFRPGRVPIKMIRRMRGEDVKNEIVDNLTKEVFEDMVKSSDHYRLLGTPREIRRDYELDEDLLVQVEFYVVPQVELQDVTGQVLEIPVSDEITERVIEFFIRRRMSRHLANRPLEEGEKIGEGAVGMLDQVEYRVTEVDSVTGLVLIGSESKKENFDFGGAEGLDPDAGHVYRTAFTGRIVGDKVNLSDTEDEGLQSADTEKKSYFQAEILDALRFEWPEIDDGWATIVSEKEVNTAEELQGWARENLSNFFEEHSKYVLDFQFINRMQVLHPFNFSTSFAEEMRGNLLGKWGNDPNALQYLQDYMAHLRWLILLEAIEGQIELDSSEEVDPISDNETKPEVDSEIVAGSEGLRSNPLTAHLLEQFEVSEIPVPEEGMMHLIAKNL